MKPDGVDTAAMEPMEVLVAEPVAEGPALEEEPQQAPPPAQPEEGAKEQQPETQTAPPAAKEGNNKLADPKAKTKGPAKTKPGASGTKNAGASGPGARPGTAQNRIVNGVQKPLANGVAKKTSTTAAEKKKPTTNSTTTAAAPSKRPVGTVTASAARTPTKVADKKPVGATRPTSAPSGTNGAKTTGTAQLNKKVAASPVNGAKAKPKTAAPRPASAAPPKPSTAPTTKTDRPTVSKTTRPPGGPSASRPAPTTTAAKPNATASTRPASSRTGTAAPSTGRTAVVQPTKSTAPVKKDVSKPTTAPAKKPPAAPTRPTTAKTSKPEPPKPTAAARPEPSIKKPLSNNKAVDAKPARPKPQDSKPPVSASPRAAGPRPGLTKTATPSPKKPVGSSAPTPVKRAAKPTQTVQPLAASGEPAKKTEVKKPAAAAAATAAAAAAAATAAAVAVAATEPQAPVDLEQPPAIQREEQVEMASLPAVLGAAEGEPVDVPAQQLENLLDIGDLEAPPAPPMAPLGTTVLSPPSSPPGLVSLPPEAQKLAAPESPVQEEWKGKAEDEDILVQVAEPEPMAAIPSDLHAAVVPGSPALEREEAVEKADEEDNEDEDEEEEEREGSQQVSVSDMSGTQPTEESRPGSAGLAGSMWRAGALLSELDSEEVSGSQQGASEFSAPGVLEGTESMDDLGDASLKGADGEGVSAGSPDIETVPDIPANEEEDDDDDDEDQVYDMEVGSERVEDPRRVRQDGEDEDEDEDVEMASEGVTESGLESYGNADEDDFAEDDRLDNLNRAQPPSLLPTAPPAQWSQTNPFADPWAQPPQPAAALLASPSSEAWPADPETPTQSPAQAWLELSSATLVPQTEESLSHPQALQECVASEPQPAPVAPVEQESSKPVQPPAPLAPPARGMSQSSTLSGTELAAQSSSETSTPEELRDYNSSSGVESRSEEKQQTPAPPAQPDTEQDLGIHLERGDGEEEEEAETLPADEVLGGPPTAPTSAPSSPSTSGDEASDTEGEMQINDQDTQGIDNMAFDSKPGAQNLPALEEREETGEGEEGGDTPQSANSVASYGFDCTTSNSNAHSTAESCGKSPGIFSLENEDQLPEEAKDPSLIKELTLPAAAADLPLGAPVDLLPLGQAEEAEPNPDEQQYMLCGKLGAELPDQSAVGGPLPQEPGMPLSPQHSGEGSDVQPPYYSAICEKTDNILSGGCERDRQTDVLQQREEDEKCTLPPARAKPWQLPFDHVTQPRQPADLPLQNAQKQPNAQLRRLEQHQQQLLQIQQSRERRRQQEEEEKERLRQEEEEEEEERQEQQRQLEQQRKDLLQLQLHLQQQEQKHRHQILQWQHELEQQHRQQQQQQQQQQHKVPAAGLLSPSSGLCTIYEAMETSDEEEDDKEPEKGTEDEREEQVLEKEEEGVDPPSEPIAPDSPQPTQPPRPVPSDSPLPSPSEALPHPPLDLDWSKKVDIVQQLINETLLLAGDGCSPLLLLPGGGGGTLSPLETSLWPTLLPPLTPPSATVTSVSSFSPEDQGSSPQGEWTVVELETHH